MVQVRVTDGVLEGEWVENDIAKFYSFKGIPYAEPPLGDLRFKAPKALKPWNEVRSAKTLGPNCYQYNMLTNTESGSEDCLYLNVYSPEIKPNYPLPVMVWIHGGAFFSGSGDDDLFGPEYLINQEVIVVTINYRLEVLGFLCLDTEDVPGNAGMKDQVAALKWVKQNISNFGGDPDNVTIFGESAGGASVSYHLVSPMTKGLFKKAIAQSGASTCWWSQAFEPRETALALARKLGFHSEDDKELAKFFRSQPVESLVQIQIPTILAEYNKRDLQFVVVNEKQFGNNERFFYGDPYDVLKNGVHEGVEVLTGYTEHEGVLFLKNIDEIPNFYDLLNNFRDYLVPRPISLNCTASQRLELGRKIKKYYFGDDYITVDHIEKIMNYYGFDLFIYGVVQWAKICANTKKNKVYMYKFTCKSERNFISNMFGVQHYLRNKVVVCHGDDLPYLFPIKITNTKVEKASETYKLIENVTRLWTNFAKYGNPTPDNSLGVKWAEYDTEKQQYLDIGNQLTMRSALNDEDVKFWEDIFKEYYPKYAA